MTQADILARTRSYVTENFLYARPDFHLEGDDSLLATGVLDSMAAMELVAFAEQEFGIAVDDVDITEANFGTLGSIASYVLRRRSGNPLAIRR